MSAERHIVVVGGGVAGLSAANALLDAGGGEDGAPLRVTLLEGSDRLGGKVRTETIAGEQIDVGAESLLSSTPGTIERCERLGLRGQLLSPRLSATCVWTGGRLRALPPGILGGMPDGVGPVLRSRILSPAGIARAALDLLAPASRLHSEPTVGEIVGARFGRQVLERMVDPLLGTIYAAGCDELSARATVPHIEAAVRAHRSLLLGLRLAAAERRASAGAPPPSGRTPAGPPLVSLPGGLQQLTGALAERLREADVRLGVRAGPLMRSADGRLLLTLSDGQALAADGAVIAVPAGEAAAILGLLWPAASRSLRAVSYASTMILTLRYPASAAPSPPPWAGMLVPRGQRRLLGAVTFLSAKWEHIGASGDIWLRCSIGRDSVSQAMDMDEGSLIDQIAAELRQALGLSGRPLQAHLTRWEQSLPIHEPGHLQRIAAVRDELDALPALQLAGAAYGGIGVPSCMQQGEEAAQRVIGALRDPAPGTPAACPLPTRQRG